MAFHENCITMVGNLTEDPELRYTGNGAAVCNLRVASNRRWTDRDGQQQEETTFMNVVAWRELGENAASSLRKGDRVVVIGRLQVRDYEDRDGVRRWVTEINADEIAPSLRWAQARPDKSRNAAGPRREAAVGAGAAPSPEPDMDDVPF